MVKVTAKILTIGTCLWSGVCGGAAFGIQSGLRRLQGLQSPLGEALRNIQCHQTVGRLDSMDLSEEELARAQQTLRSLDGNLRPPTRVQSLTRQGSSTSEAPNKILAQPLPSFVSMQIS